MIKQKSLFLQITIKKIPKIMKMKNYYSKKIAKILFLDSRTFK